MSSQMDNLRTAISLSLVAERHMVVRTTDYDSCAASLKDVLLSEFVADNLVEIDLLECNTYDNLVASMVKRREATMPELYSFILWKNLENIEMTLKQKSDILRILNEIERYNTLASKSVDTRAPIQLGEFSTLIPQLFLIIPVIVAENSFPKINRQLKDRFLFCQSLVHNYDQEILADSVNTRDILHARSNLHCVHANAQIQEYICSLLVFTRTHRLCSLAPLSTRPSIKALEGVMLLAKALAAWTHLEDTRKLFVTSNHVKVAFRKVGYWLVDWETNTVFFDKSAEATHRKLLEISMLSGDWYGSEWECVEEYLEKFVTCKSDSSSTGFTNPLIEDVLQNVMPPM